ncbi:MAG TPA: hypothetical protein VFT74_11980, partial [Isosphaeraceae bacterium]|nr:hypothetical protein [Isosphaeraceae bacterium]
VNRDVPFLGCPMRKEVLVGMVAVLLTLYSCLVPLAGSSPEPAVVLLTTADGHALDETHTAHVWIWPLDHGSSTSPRLAHLETILTEEESSDGDSTIVGPPLLSLDLRLQNLGRLLAEPYSACRVPCSDRFRVLRC